MLKWMVLFLSFSLLACTPKQPWEEKSADSALTQFLWSLEVQDHDTVWEFLSDSDRNALDALAKPIKGKEGKDMLQMGHVLSSTREYKKFEILSKKDDWAEVAIVLHDESKIRVVMQKERGRWTVDLGIARATKAKAIQ